MSSVLERLKQRKLVQWAFAYLAGAWVLLQVADTLGDNFGWPRAVFQSLAAFLGVGFFAALILAWYHGEQGRQRVSGPELLILTAVCLVGGGVVWLIGNARTSTPTPPAAENSRALAATPTDRSIAVLPFANLSESKANEYFSDGITDDILTSLSRIAGLRVISRTSAMKYKGTDKGLPEIARELGVAHVLEGSVRRAGDRVRITAQLINAKTDEHLWAESYDRDATDVFAIQTEIAERIASALQVRLSAGDQARLGESGTANLAAYDLYLKAREHLYRIEPGMRELQATFDSAITLFRQALEQDPDYALAYVGLARAYLWHPDLPLEARYDSAVAFSQRAIQLSPSLPDGYVELGQAYLSRNPENPARAAAEFRRALQRDPNHVEALAGIVEYEWGRLRLVEALRYAKRVVALAPLEIEHHERVARLYENLGDFAAAEQWYRKAWLEISTTPWVGHCELAKVKYQQGDRAGAARHIRAMLAAVPDAPFAWQCAGWLELHLGNFAAAKTHLERYAATVSGDDVPKLELGYLALQAGERERGERLLREAEAIFRKRWEYCNGRCSNSGIAMALALRGETEEAIRFIRRSTETGWNNSYPSPHSLRRPFLAPLESDPRYQEMMANLKANFDRQRRQAQREGLN